MYKFLKRLKCNIPIQCFILQVKLANIVEKHSNARSRKEQFLVEN